jgi:peptidyl-Asp metalloendopeptidase
MLNHLKWGTVAIAAALASVGAHAADVKIFGTHAQGATLARLESARPADLPGKGTFPVNVNMRQLRKLPIGAEADLNLPDGRTVAVVHDETHRSESGNVTFVGHLRDQGMDYRVILTEAPNGLANGIVTLPEGGLRLEGRTGQTWLIDPQRAGIGYAPMAEPRLPEELSSAVERKRHEAAEGSAEGVMAPLAQTTVDVMVVYTPNMVSRYGGDAGARARVDSQMAIFNQILRDSAVEVTARLVKAMYVNQDDNVNQGTLLTMITNGQGAFSNVRPTRDSVKADVVHLLHKPTVGVGSCGIAYLSVTKGPTGHADWAYGVTDDNCPTMVMAHEIGHNFGMNHDHAQGGGEPVFPYAWGYIVPGTNYGDVMSYAGTHYYKYSNPRIGGCSGQACGQDGWADAARAMNETKGIVANYRIGAAPQACFYEHINYTGRALCSSTDNSWVGASWNDMFSSVRVPAGTRVTLYEHANYGGRALVLTGDTSSLVPANFNDMTSSFRVAR